MCAHPRARTRVSLGVHGYTRVRFCAGEEAGRCWIPWSFCVQGAWLEVQSSRLHSKHSSDSTLCSPNLNLRPQKALDGDRCLIAAGQQVPLAVRQSQGVPVGERAGDPELRASSCFLSHEKPKFSTPRGLRSPSQDNRRSLEWEADAQ